MKRIPSPVHSVRVDERQNAPAAVRGGGNRISHQIAASSSERMISIGLLADNDRAIVDPIFNDGVGNRTLKASLRIVQK